MIEYTVKVSEDGDRHWYLNGERHREDGPAIEYANGDRFWYLHGKLHRTAGPAVEFADGTPYWFLHGNQVTEEAVMNPAKELTVAEIEKLLGHKVKIVK
jgi:hypothetical protein